MNKLWVLIVGILLLGTGVFAQVQVSPLLKLEHWGVSVLGVRTDNYEDLNAIQKEVAVAIRPVLSAVLKEVSEHHLSTEEKRNAQVLIKTDALSILSDSLEAIHSKDDTAALANEDLDIWDQQLNSRKQRREIKRKIRKIERIDSNDISVPERLPVKPIEQIQYLSISNIVDFRKIAIELNAHSLLYYHIYPVENYVIIEIFEYNTLTSRSQKVLSTIVNPKNVFQIYRSLQLSLQSVLLGTESASLGIELRQMME